MENRKAKKPIWRPAGTACLLSVCLLLASCGGTEQSGSAAASAEEPAAVSGEAGQSAETAGESMAEEQETGPSRDASYRWTLLEEEGVTLEYIDVLGMDDGARLQYISCTNENDEDLIVEMEDFRINDTILTEQQVSFFPEAGETALSELPELHRAFQAAETDGIAADSISCKVTIESWEYDETGNPTELFSGDCRLEFPDGFTPAYVCEPVCGMRAEKQILAENDRVCITLLGCGNYYGSLYDLGGIVQIENRTDSSIPAEIEGMMINGFYADVYSSGEGEIAPGTSCLIWFYCPNSVEEDLEIASITELELQIMTDPEESTGSVTLKGGSWYPVQLAESGSGEQSFDPGETVFENEWVTIGLRGVESEWQDVDEFNDEAYGYWEWNLSFVNRSGDNLEIRFTDETVNGETLPEFGTDTYLILEDSEIGAGAKKYTTLSFRTTEKMEQPEVAFRVQVRTQGGGKLLDYSDEITISPQ